MPRPAVILFDLDGTLVDHDGALRQGLIGWLTSKELATEDQCARGLVALWDEVAERHFPAFRSGEITFQEQRRRRLREFLPHLDMRVERLDDAALDLIFEDYLEHYESAWSAFDDVLPCLASLHGLRVAVLSNSDQAQQEDKLRRTGLDGRFEIIMTSSALGAAKPDPGRSGSPVSGFPLIRPRSPTSATGSMSTRRRQSGSTPLTVVAGL